MHLPLLCPDASCRCGWFLVSMSVFLASPGFLCLHFFVLRFDVCVSSWWFPGFFFWLCFRICRIFPVFPYLPDSFAFSERCMLCPGVFHLHFLFLCFDVCVSLWVFPGFFLRLYFRICRFFPVFPYLPGSFTFFEVLHVIPYRPPLTMSIEFFMGWRVTFLLDCHFATGPPFCYMHWGALFPIDLYFMLE